MGHENLVADFEEMRGGPDGDVALTTIDEQAEEGCLAGSRPFSAEKKKCCRSSLDNAWWIDHWGVWGDVNQFMGYRCLLCRMCVCVCV